MFNYFVESTLCFTAFYIYYHFLLRNETCLNFKRFYLIGTSLLSLAMPLLQLDLINTPVLSQVVFNEITIIDVTEKQPTRVTLYNLLLSIYLIVAVSLFLRVCIHLMRIRKVIQQGIKHRKRSHILIQTTDELAPSSFLSYIFWSGQMPPEKAEQQVIMDHEIAHVEGWHTIDMLFFELLKSIFWFNPIIHFYRKEASANLEFIADYQTAPEDYSTYNSILASNAIASLGFSLENHFNKSFTLKRIEMLKRKKEKTNQFRLLATIPVVITLFILISCDNDLAGTEEANEILTRNQQVFEQVDEPPLPDGGIKGLYEFVATNLKYPTDARKKGIEGKVFVQFVVTNTGDVTDVTVTEGLGHGCDQASIEVIQAFKNWTPGVKDGENVSVRLTLPITFKLS